MPHARRSLAQQLLKFLNEPVVAVRVRADSELISWEDAYAFLDGLDPRAAPDEFPEVTLWTATRIVLVFAPKGSPPAFVIRAELRDPPVGLPRHRAHIVHARTHGPGRQFG